LKQDWTPEMWHKFVVVRYDTNSEKFSSANIGSPISIPRRYDTTSHRGFNSS